MVYDHKHVQEKIQTFWEKIDLLGKLSEQNKDGSPYFLLDGPPYANFMGHVGHIRNTVMKDLFIRVAFMQGRNVLFQPGFDTHGLPIENKVEKKLEISNKRQIYELGVDTFTKACKEEATINKDSWINVYKNLGSWYSWKKPYLTFDADYMNSEWWAFKELHKNGLVYEGKKPVYWCSSCETALAGYEVTDSYKMLHDPALYVKFKVTDRDEYLVVFTTTPWTLISNVAIVAHPDEMYVRARTSQGVLILAEKRLEILKDFGVEYDVLETFPGSSLNGLSYDPIVRVQMQDEIRSHAGSGKVHMSIRMLKERVAGKVATKMNVASGDVFEDFVSVDSGSGMVHCAPGHGKTDNLLGKHYNLFEASPVKDDGTFDERAGKYEGVFVKKADKDILKELEEHGSILNLAQASHKYPVCWRCKNPLIFRMSNQWFVKIKNEEMLEANKSVVWQPEFARERFEHWVANAEDWNISRQRFWGCPIPVWKSEDGDVIVIGSKEELEEYVGDKLDLDLHEASSVVFDFEGKAYSRVKDILDVWFDAAVAPFAAIGAPHVNDEQFISHFPVDRINESQDQVRGWFYYLSVIGVGVFGKNPFKHVSMPGWVLDQKGDKMSKSLGNVIWADEGLDMFGADALRFYYCWDTAPYETQKFNVDVVKKDVQGIFNTFLNVASYAMEVVDKVERPKAIELEDRWIVSKYNSFLKRFYTALDEFKLHECGRAFEDFMIKSVSREYIQMTRSRTQAGDLIPQQMAAYFVIECCKVMAPICPFLCEDIYLKYADKFDAKESVHLESLPSSDESLIHDTLEANMSMARSVITAGLAAREKGKISSRWPLPEIVIESRNEDVELVVQEMGNIIQDQLNVKQVSVVKEMPGSQLSMRFDNKSMGKAFGADLPRVKKLIEAQGADSMYRQLKDERVQLTEGNDSFEIMQEHVIFDKSCPQGYQQSSVEGGYAYLNVNQTKELLDEGYARELMRHVQQARKDAGLVKEDRIKLHVKTKYTGVDLYSEHIADKCGCDDVYIGPDAGDLTERASVKVKDEEFVIYF